MKQLLQWTEIVVLAALQIAGVAVALHDLTQGPGERPQTDVQTPLDTPRQPG